MIGLPERAGPEGADPEGSGQRFPCAPGGAIRRGRRRLAGLLLGLALLLVAVAGAAWWSGRRWPAVLALAVALVPWMAWRMSGDLDPLWLELESEAGGEIGGPRRQLVVQMRRRRERRDLAGAAARRLTPGETAHLERLVSAGGVSAGTGGFDSQLLGEFDLAASDLAHAVLLDWGESRLIVTPDEPEAFLAALAVTAEPPKAGRPHPVLPPVPTRPLPGGRDPWAE
jgi:hypothetical protein